MFRDDLFHRLNVVPIDIPPLRERKQDIPALVQHFVLSSGSLKVFEPDAILALQDFPWPGNIRELESLVRRLAVLHTQDVINYRAIQSELVKIAPPLEFYNDPSPTENLFQIMRKVVTEHFDAHYMHRPLESLEELHDYAVYAVEKPLIEWVLRRTGGNQIKAAEVLGINRNTLRTKIRQMGIEVKK